MNTPAHLILGAAVFARPDALAVTLAALAGSIVPDLSLYLMAGWHLIVLETPARVVFDELYFSDRWQSVFAIDNSFVIWGAVFGLALALKSAALTAFAGSGLLHLATDFPLHHDDGRMHFWPLSDWVFQSPLSYWDHRHYGNIIGPVEVAMCLLLLALLWRRFRKPLARIIIVVAAVAQIAPSIIWAVVFAAPSA